MGFFVPVCVCVWIGAGGGEGWCQCVYVRACARARARACVCVCLLLLLLLLCCFVLWIALGRCSVRVWACGQVQRMVRVYVSLLGEGVAFCFFLDVSNIFYISAGTLSVQISP